MPVVLSSACTHAVGVAEHDRQPPLALEVDERRLALASRADAPREPGQQGRVVVDGDRAPLLAHAAAGVGDRRRIVTVYFSVVGSVFVVEML